MINQGRFANASFVVGREMEEEVVSDLKSNPPAGILARSNRNNLIYKPYHERIASHIRSHYHVQDRMGSFVILVPK